MTTSNQKCLNPDMPADELRLHMGELDASQLRVARSAIRWANSVAITTHPVAKNHYPDCDKCGGFDGQHWPNCQVQSNLPYVPPKPCRICGHAEPENEFIPPVRDIDDIRQVARSLGYSITIHGSLKRDCDLVAVPWTDQAEPAETLIRAICRAIDGHLCGKQENRPHGRISVAIQPNAWCKYIDLSIMPLKKN